MYTEGLVYSSCGGRGCSLLVQSFEVHVVTSLSAPQLKRVRLAQAWPERERVSEVEWSGVRPCWCNRVFVQELLWALS